MQEMQFVFLLPVTQCIKSECDMLPDSWISTVATATAALNHMMAVRLVFFLSSGMLLYLLFCSTQYILLTRKNSNLSMLSSHQK